MYIVIKIPHMNHPFTAFHFLISFASAIYADYNGIFLIFIRVTV